MPKTLNQATIEDADPEENHRTASRTLDPQVSWGEFHEAVKYLKRRTGSNDATVVSIGLIHGDGNGTPDRIRIVASY